MLGAGVLLALSPVGAQQGGADAKGPSQVTLGQNLATLQLPKGWVYLGEAKAKALMKEGGGQDADVIGFLTEDSKDSNFGIVLEFEKTGYVKDDDAGKIDPKAILESYQEGTKAHNDERKSRGLSPLTVTGWEQEPKYEKASHVVIWSLQGENGEKEQFVNYNTRILGRSGVMSVNLMCDNKDLPAVRPKSQAIVKNIAFNSGQRYEDFKQGDKVSTGGLVALIAGGALLAKKTGVIAFLLAMLKPLLLLVKAAGAKVIVLIGAALAWVGKAIFGKKNAD